MSINIENIDKSLLTMAKYETHFQGFMDRIEDINNYLNKMKLDGTWGGYFELIALSEALEVDFCLHFVDEDPYTVSSEIKIDENRRKYHLVYYTDVHYSSLRRIKDHKFDFVGTPSINYNVDVIQHEKLEVWKERKRDFLKRIVRKVFYKCA